MREDIGEDEDEHEDEAASTVVFRPSGDRQSRS